MYRTNEYGLGNGLQLHFNRFREEAWMVLVKLSFRVHSLNELNRTTIFYTGVVIPDSAQCRVVCSANAALSYSPKEPDWRHKKIVLMLHINTITFTYIAVKAAKSLHIAIDCTLKLPYNRA